MQTEKKEETVFARHCKLLFAVIAALAIFLLPISTVQAQSMQVDKKSCPNGNFKITNTSIECIMCQAGFLAINGTCIPQAKSLNSQNTGDTFIKKFEAFINKNSKVISPENPPFGTILQFAAIMSILIYGFAAFKKMFGGKR